MIGLLLLIAILVLYFYLLCWIAERVNIPCAAMIVCFIPGPGTLIFLGLLIFAIAGKKVM